MDLRSLVAGLCFLTLARADDDFREFKGHDGPVRAVQFTSECKLVASGGRGGPTIDGKPTKGEDFMVRVWKLDE